MVSGLGDFGKVAFLNRGIHGERGGNGIGRLARFGSRDRIHPFHDFQSFHGSKGGR
jgi:hypothetical protein